MNTNLNKRDFTRWLEEELRARFRSIANAAVVVGTTHTTLYDIINGNREPSFDILAQIAPHLDLSAVEMFRKADKIKPPPVHDNRLVNEILFDLEDLDDAGLEAVKTYIDFVRFDLGKQKKTRGTLALIHSRN